MAAAPTASSAAKDSNVARNFRSRRAKEFAPIRARDWGNVLANVVDELAVEVGMKRACEGLDVARSTQYRRRRPRPFGPQKARPRPPRALKPAEQEHVLAVLRSEEYVDKAPETIWAELLDLGIYLCSPRTMYRFLHMHQEVRERRAQRRLPEYKRPELMATAPRQIWSWDISVPQKAAQEMGVGPPQSACRSRLQTTVSGLGQKPRS